ncbi:hypothetical protein O7542_13765 [Micromonospora sp. WMMC264]|uniref:hypothetical protein n=1 Tax=Micromonospora sp. WMMC264 TaxID=3015158 RepID=UPI00248C8AF9|nr:hypothetical protein [Micromonospora sp. WMMC264]WBB88169.1 hypothetical protein O7542_13765 [Micromonospora sp. WMMC264]
MGRSPPLTDPSSVADALLLLRLLDHEKLKVQAQAARSLRPLAAVVVGEVATLLRDPSSSGCGR